MGITLGLYLLYCIIYFIQANGYGYLVSNDIKLMVVILAAIIVFGLLCLLVCKFLLRFRIREIINKSIIDNIREL